MTISILYIYFIYLSKAATFLLKCFSFFIQNKRELFMKQKNNFVKSSHIFYSSWFFSISELSKRFCNGFNLR